MLKIIKRFVFGVLLLFIAANVSYAQATKVMLVRAKELTYNKELHPDMKRVIGDVVFKHDSTYLYCDSAYFFDKKNNVNAFGNVHIQESDTFHIYSELLEYDGNTKIAEMEKKVKLVDDQTTLTTDKLTFNRKTNTVSYYKGGKIVSKDNVLTSKKGYYFTNTKKFFFKDEVVLTNPQYVINSDTLMYNTHTKVSFFFGPTTMQGKDHFIYCENGWYNTITDFSQFQKNAYLQNKQQFLSGDSLFYDGNIDFGKALHNVVLIDTARNIISKGEYAEYHKAKGYSIITDRAVTIFADKTDSLFLHADTLKALFDKQQNPTLLFAYHKMKFYRENLQGACDSLVYNFSDSLVTMFHDPVLWSEKNQITADTIKLLVRHNQIQEMHLLNSAFIASTDDGKKFNQIKGKMMTGYFTDNELSKVMVNGNAESVYVAREDNGSLIGINKAESTDMLILVSERKIKSITFINQPKATLYPEGELTEKELILKGFKWKEDRRPKNKEDIFN